MTQTTVRSAATLDIVDILARTDLKIQVPHPHGNTVGYFLLRFIRLSLGVGPIIGGKISPLLGRHDEVPDHIVAAPVLVVPEITGHLCIGGGRIGNPQAFIGVGEKIAALTEGNPPDQIPGRCQKRLFGNPHGLEVRHMGIDEILRHQHVVFQGLRFLLKKKLIVRFREGSGDSTNDGTKKEPYRQENDENTPQGNGCDFRKNCLHLPMLIYLDRKHKKKV